MEISQERVLELPELLVGILGLACLEVFNILQELVELLVRVEKGQWVRQPREVLESVEVGVGVVGRF